MILLSITTRDLYIM